MTWDKVRALEIVQELAKKGRRSAKGPVHSQVHRRAEYRLCPVEKNAGRQEVHK